MGSEENGLPTDTAIGHHFEVCKNYHYLSLKTIFTGKNFYFWTHKKLKKKERKFFNRVSTRLFCIKACSIFAQNISSEVGNKKQENINRNLNLTKKIHKEIHIECDYYLSDENYTRYRLCSYGEYVTWLGIQYEYSTDELF